MTARVCVTVKFVGDGSWWEFDVEKNKKFQKNVDANLKYQRHQVSGTAEEDP